MKTVEDTYSLRRRDRSLVVCEVKAACSVGSITSLGSSFHRSLGFLLSVCQEDRRQRRKRLGEIQGKFRGFSGGIVKLLRDLSSLSPSDVIAAWTHHQSLLSIRITASHLRSLAMPCGCITASVSASGMSRSCWPRVG